MTHNELNFQSIKVFGLVFLIMVLGISFSCNSGKQPTTETTKDSIIQSPPTEVVQPEWAYSANIYELNIRQFTKEGTFKALDPHLARLKEMGVDIIWLMPINPIGKKNRKGTLGSYYSVKDYMTVNPEYGTLDDFKTFVAKAHELGLKVIIDWVPNHSSWDNVLTVKHPDFYVRDEKGKFLPPVADWSDVIELNYDNPTMRKFMVDAMQYWIKETDIDGYRCDVAHGVPNDFWDDLRPALDSIKPVFMLAEAEIPEQQYKAFNMSYSWELHHIIHQIAKGEKNLMSLDTYFVKQKKLYPVDAYRMNFTTNHDENSWNGTNYEKFGDGALAFHVLISTIPGMPLIYTGQESEMKKRLQFFEKDPVDWGNYPLAGFFTTLNKLKKDNKALWNGAQGGDLVRLTTTNDKNVYAFVREKDGNKVVAIINLSATEQSVSINAEKCTGTYTEVFTNTKTELVAKNDMKLAPWSYQVLVNK